MTFVLYFFFFFCIFPQAPTGKNMILIDGGIRKEKAFDMFRLI
jgi:hypothetical protein